MHIAINLYDQHGIITEFHGNFSPVFYK